MCAATVDFAPEGAITGYGQTGIISNCYLDLETIVNAFEIIPRQRQAKSCFISAISSK